MSTTGIAQRVGIVGGGLMGSGLAEVCARAGARVSVAVTRPASLDAARHRVAGSLAAAVRRGKLTAEDETSALARTTFTTDLGDLSDCELVIESVPEDLTLKAAVFRDLDATLDRPDAILATNTSSLPVAALAAPLRRSGRFVGTHFFNPVPVMQLVEVVPLVQTEDDVLPRLEAFLRDGLGKTVIRSADRPGFVVNALLLPFLLSAIRLVQSGDATPSVIDQGMVLGCAHPMGPLRLADMVGLDTLASMAQRLHATSGDPSFRPPELLLEMVGEGRTGIKSGAGFYTYENGSGNRGR